MRNSKISRENKNAYIWDKKKLIWIFYGWNLKRIFSYLKWALSNLHNCKISLKNKMSIYWTNSALFGYLWAEILKQYCHIWNQHPQVCQKWAFNSYTKFWYKICFFLKVWGLLFLKVPVQVGDPFIKNADLFIFFLKSPAKISTLFV